MILHTVGAGLTVGLAGCSGNGQDGSGDGENELEPTDSTQTDETVSATTETSPTASDTENSDTSGDVVHTGEEQLEQYISTAGDPDDLPENLSSYTALGSSEFIWVEFEQIRDQVDIEVGTFNDAPATIRERGNIDEFNNWYLALRVREGTEGDYGVIWAGLLEGQWDEDSTAIENYQNFYEGGWSQETPEDTEEFFAENINAYSDVSDGFPQEYLDLIKE